MLQTLRRRIDVLSKQKSDIKASLTAAKSSCESKSGDNESLRSQIKVRNLCNEDSWDHRRTSLSAPLSSVIGLQLYGLSEALLPDLSLLHVPASLITCPKHVETFLLSPDVPDLRFLV